MATTINYSHGDTGTQPSDGHDFQDGNAADPQKFDWYIDTFVKRINELVNDINNGNIDAATLDGSAGTNGEVLKSDGTDTFWGTASQYTDEDAQDAVGTIMGGSGVTTVNYDDANDTITVDSSHTHTGDIIDPDELDLPDTGTNPSADGEIRHNTGDVIVHTGGGTLNLSNVGTSGYSDEDAQDAVGTIMTGSGATSVTYDDANDTITVSSTDTDTSDHDNLTGVSSGDHHSRYSDSEAITAINNDADHGSTASHNYFSGSHNDLSDVGSSDHHSKYTDSDAETAINNDADHGSTASHNYFSGSHDDLSNVSSGDHHTQPSTGSGLSGSSTFTVDESYTFSWNDSHTYGAASNGNSEAIKFTTPDGYQALIRSYEDSGTGNTELEGAGSDANTTTLT